MASLNTLATSEDIMNQQALQLGLSITPTEVSSTTTTAAAASGEISPVPTPTPSTTPFTSTMGPSRTGKTLFDLLVVMGFPSSFATAIDDMQEAFLGIVHDALGKSSERKSLTDIITYKNRLRGIGILLIFTAIVGLLLETILS